MGDAAALTSGADWAPPAYLLAVLKREDEDWRGVSMRRRTAALRAVETANALLYAAEQLVDPRTSADRAERLAERVTRTHLQDCGQRDLQRLARLKIIEYVENCWQDERLIDGSLATLAVLFPEFPVDARLFRQAVDAWKHEDIPPNNPDGPGKWKAVCELLRLPLRWKGDEPPIAAERRRWKKTDHFNTYTTRTMILHPELAPVFEDGPAFSGRASLCFRDDLIERVSDRGEFGALLMGGTPKFLQASQTTYAEVHRERLWQEWTERDRKSAAQGEAPLSFEPTELTMEEATRHLERPEGKLDKPPAAS